MELINSSHWASLAKYINYLPGINSHIKPTDFLPFWPRTTGVTVRKINWDGVPLGFPKICMGRLLYYSYLPTQKYLYHQTNCLSKKAKRVLKMQIIIIICILGVSGGKIWDIMKIYLSLSTDIFWIITRLSIFRCGCEAPFHLRWGTHSAAVYGNEILTHATFIHGYFISWLVPTPIMLSIISFIIFQYIISCQRGGLQSACNTQLQGRRELGESKRTGRTSLLSRPLGKDTK